MRGGNNCLRILISCLLLSNLLVLSRAEVITLTADTFSDKYGLKVAFFLACSGGGYDFVDSVAQIAVYDGSLVEIKEKDTAWFVKFCVPWCKHCKNLGSLWEDLGKVMEGEDEIEIGEVDCALSKPACAKADIHSYPTFKLFYSGEEVVKYQGSREVESLKAFVVEETGKAVAKAEAEIDNDRDL